MSLKKDNNNKREKSKFSVLVNKTENFIFIDEKRIKKQKIVIKKKIEKKANKRNKIRRRIREILKSETKSETTVIVRNKIINKKYNEIKNEIASIIQKGEKEKSE